MNKRSEALVPQGSLPELRISASMRSAASSVAASFNAYQSSCYDLPNARDAGEIPQNLQAQRERKQAYHLALKFLSTATLKENPDYNIEHYGHLADEAQQQLQALLTPYLDRKLNDLVKEEANKTGHIRYQTSDHPVVNGPW